MQNVKEQSEKQITIAINTQDGLDKLRKLVDELEDGIILSMALSEVIDGGQEDG